MMTGKDYGDLRQQLIVALDCSKGDVQFQQDNGQPHIASPEE